MQTVFIFQCLLRVERLFFIITATHIIATIIETFNRLRVRGSLFKFVNILKAAIAIQDIIINLRILAMGRVFGKKKGLYGLNLTGNVDCMASIYPLIYVIFK